MNESEGHSCPYDLAKCAKCGWFYYVGESGVMKNSCRCGGKSFARAPHSECPIGVTLSPIYPRLVDNYLCVCGQIMEIVEPDEPWYGRHLQCPKCGSTKH